MKTLSDLRQLLLRLDQRGYKAYKAIQGRYASPTFTLSIDRVQGDPFASPSQCRVRVPQAIAQFPPELFANRSREMALRDYLTRQFHQGCQHRSQRRGSGNSGLITIDRPSQCVLERTTVLVNATQVELRFVVGLPAQGRRIDGQEAADVLCETLPHLVQSALLYSNLDGSAVQRHVETVEDGDALRQALGDRGLVAFVANGSILPRRSGVDDRPLVEGGVPFQSPPSLEVTLQCPNRGLITGMGIPTGVTLIVGGGYHGKSTVLQAIERGVYTHIPGDGREQVVTVPTAMKIQAESGRSVAGVNISPFINHLPQGRSTTQFSTPNASGSTSQAANVMEALEAGASVLLVDEDTAATNFMIRDRRMQLLIAKDKEPITPFIDKVRQLYQDFGVSTVLVMGGSGDYFDVADTVIALDNFEPFEVTAQARAIAQTYQTGRQGEGGAGFGDISQRVIRPDSVDPSRGNRAVRWKVRDRHTLSFGTEEIDLSAVEQVVELGQVRAIAFAMVYAQRHYLDGQRSLKAVLDGIMAAIERGGLDALTGFSEGFPAGFLSEESPGGFPEGDLAQFRPLELAATLNRLRTLQVVASKS